MGKTENYNKQTGISIIGMIFLAGVIIFVLSYFNISIRSIINSPTGQENVSYVREGTKSLWETYLAKPASYLWNDVWVNIFWKGFISNMERIRDGKATDFDKAGDNLKVPQ
jgi:hypothetical protein